MHDTALSALKSVILALIEETMLKLLPPILLQATGLYFHIIISIVAVKILIDNHYHGFSSSS